MENYSLVQADFLKNPKYLFLYLAIAILAAFLFIVMIILAVVLILLRKKQQEKGTWILFALSIKFNVTCSHLYRQGNLGVGLIYISFNIDSTTVLKKKTKSFRPIWEGRTLTQKCRDRWFNALKNDKSQKANADVVA